MSCEQNLVDYGHNFKMHWMMLISTSKILWATCKTIGWWKVWFRITLCWPVIHNCDYGWFIKLDYSTLKFSTSVFSSFSIAAWKWYFFLLRIHIMSWMIFLLAKYSYYENQHVLQNSRPSFSLEFGDNCYVLKHDCSIGIHYESGLCYQLSISWYEALFSE